MFGLFHKFNNENEGAGVAASILVIEDSEADRMLIQRTLGKRNYSVIVAYDGEAGLKLVHEHKFDLIILDYLLPGMNGVEICKILKEDGRTRNIPVIFLTVVEAGEVILECYGAGAEFYMHKPIDSKYLLKEVGSILAGTRENNFEED